VIVQIQVFRLAPAAIPSIWLARTYARKAKPADGLVFDAAVLSRRDEVLKKAFVQFQALGANAYHDAVVKLHIAKADAQGEAANGATVNAGEARGRADADAFTAMTSICFSRER